jgi:hypothetical protein
VEQLQKRTAGLASNGGSDNFLRFFSSFGLVGITQSLPFDPTFAFQRNENAPGPR